MNPVIEQVTERIIKRSAERRQRYLDLIQRQRDIGIERRTLPCSNFAHGFAAAEQDQTAIRTIQGFNIGIVTAYNDMLSAHQPYGRYPEQIKLFAREVGATAQVAGGTAAMCDGITQGLPGMELSLFSRDNIAQSTAIALSHGMFDGALLLGICDKIVPGLLIGALRYGHLPVILVPAGPMPSGLPNPEKQRIRQLFAEGKVGHDDLLEAEAQSYHAPGTCNFYGTANSNQMMMELMGLHLPGAAFVPPFGKLRQQLTREATHQVTKLGKNSNGYRPLGQCVNEKAIVNAAIGLLATGGSTNHAIHLPAIARAAGIVIDWEDFDRLSQVVPLIARIYPSGPDDVNVFHQAGGMPYVTAELLNAGLLHRDIPTVYGDDMGEYAREATLHDDQLAFTPAAAATRNDSILRPVANPFLPDGGMKLITGNLGRGIFKTSAVDPSRWTIEAEARVFESQQAVSEAFKASELNRDVIVVVRFQGPRANGMPELHKLMPPLGVLQDRGFKVALVTDGRMSGASGKVPSAIHMSPEAHGGGPLAKVRDGDRLRLCAQRGELVFLGDEAAFASRQPASEPWQDQGTGRELFALFRLHADNAEYGASPVLAAAGL